MKLQSPLQFLPVDKSVVFVIDKFSEPVHIGKLIAGVKKPSSDQMLFSLLADLSNVSRGTSVFFYKRRIDEPQSERGFIGEFKAISEAYESGENPEYSSSVILGKCPNCGHNSGDIIDKDGIKCKNCDYELEGHILPFRVNLRVGRFYTRYLDDNHAYIDITDEGRLNTLIFRKIYGPGRERGVAPILPEEALKLRRLLDRMERENINSPVPYRPTEIPPKLTSGIRIGDFINRIFDEIRKNSELKYEFMLEFYIMYKLNNKLHDEELLKIFTPFEDIEWIGNQILFGIGGDKSDILILYKNEKGRYRADVVELKRGSVSENDVQQVYKYLYWIGQLVTSNIYLEIPEVFYVEPIVIGKRLKRGFNFKSITGIRDMSGRGIGIRIEV